MFGSFKVAIPEERKTLFQDSRIGKVDVADSSNVEKWAKVLGITEDELLISVENFGSTVADIRRGRRNSRS